MARQSAMQRQIARTTGLSRYQSGAATRSSRQLYNAMRRKSRGGPGG